MKFQDFQFADTIFQAIQDLKYDQATPIQIAAIPKILEGHEILAAAQTGTGKTASFVLPILQNLIGKKAASPKHIKALILTPTRELAMQVSEQVALLGKNTGLKYTSIFGGVKLTPQIKRLNEGIDVLVATPGRLLDLYQQDAIKFDQVSFFVLDEADRMLDMGFINDLKKITSLLPKNKQTLMFSATFSGTIRKLAKNLFRQQPIEIDANQRNSTSHLVEQFIYPIEHKQKFNVTVHIIKELQLGQTLIFTRTKNLANRVTKFLQDHKIESAAIHGNKSQNARTKALSDFKENKIQVLVATDIAARGIDIIQLPAVINFNLPMVPEDYVHRIGRTGRAGATGQAISIVSKEELIELAQIEYLIKSNITRKYLTEYPIAKDIPMTDLTQKPVKLKQPLEQKKSNHTEYQAVHQQQPKKSNSNEANGTTTKKKRRFYGKRSPQS